LDGLVGCGSLASTVDTWGVFLLAQLDVAAKNEELNAIRSDDDDCWTWLCDPDTQRFPWPDEKHEVTFRATAQDLFDLFPVLLLMAATRAPAQDDQASAGFRFSNALRDFLTTADGDPPLDILLQKVRKGRDIQISFRNAVDQWLFSRNRLSRWRADLRDREVTLLAFQRALEPLRRDVRRRVSAASGGVSGSVSGNPSAQTPKADNATP